MSTIKRVQQKTWMSSKELLCKLKYLNSTVTKLEGHLTNCEPFQSYKLEHCLEIIFSFSIFFFIQFLFSSGCRLSSLFPSSFFIIMECRVFIATEGYTDQFTLLFNSLLEGKTYKCLSWRCLYENEWKSTWNLNFAH